MSKSQGCEMGKQAKMGVATSQLDPEITLTPVYNGPSVLFFPIRKVPVHGATL